MAVATMLSGQTYISLMDRIDHAHHHAHFANPLAGEIAFCFGDECGAHHRHHHDAGAGGNHHHSHDPVDHQHGDATIAFLAVQTFVLAACPMMPVRCDSEPPALHSINPRGPDHPPKRRLEIRV